jgi:hypothetical protein
MNRLRVQRVAAHPHFDGASSEETELDEVELGEPHLVDDEELPAVRRVLCHQRPQRGPFPAVSAVPRGPPQVGENWRGAIGAPRLVVGGR